MRGDGNVVLAVGYGVDGGRGPPVLTLRFQSDVAETVAVGADAVQEVQGGVVGGESGRGSQPIEVEVRTLAELDEALVNGAEAVLLDNMPVEQVREAVGRCTKVERRIPVECAGGVTLENVRAYAETGVDFISVGALTHSAVAVDMSLRVTPV